MKQHSIYISGPIDNCTRNEIVGWRNFIKKYWPQYKYHDPVDLEAKYKECTAETIQEEKNHIRDSDFFLCYPWKPGSGTAMELMYAHTLFRYGKPKIITVSTPGDYLSQWIRYHSDYVAYNFKTAFKWIELQLDDNNKIWPTRKLMSV